MRRRAIVGGFIALNVLLALALFGRPVLTQVMPESIFRDCCLELEGGEICCYDCCWFVHDCDETEDCQQ